MKSEYVFTTLYSISVILISVSIIPLTLYVVFPFFQSLSPEKKLEKYIDQQCILGNEIAISIRRRNIRYYNDSDKRLIKSAIEGNQNAIKALNLDQETINKKLY